MMICLVMMVFKGVYTSKHKPLHIAFFHNIKLSRYRIGIQLDNSVLVVEQNNNTTKIVSAYVAYDLDTWRIIRKRNFMF